MGATPDSSDEARREPPNGFELSCPAAQALVDPWSRILAGKGRFNFPHASRVSCSELLGGFRSRPEAVGDIADAR
jgi:hypothetical protein